MRHLQALLIDLDGVLRHWSPEDTLRAELACGLPEGAILRAAFAPELLQPAITGAVSDHHWRQSVVARLQRDHPHSDARTAVEIWSESAGVVDEQVLALLRRVRSKARVVLVTNATSRLAADLDRLNLARELDAVVNSSDIGAAKPAPAIFQAALQRAAVPAAAATFVDDSASHVAAAEALGIAGHVYRDPAALQQHLARLGLREA